MFSYYRVIKRICAYTSDIVTCFYIIRRIIEISLFRRIVMAITSDPMYNAKTVVPSFMSSNKYYGYVPRYKKENQRNIMLDHTGITKPSVFNCYTYDTVMETDEDGCDYSGASGYLNNSSVILESSVQNRLKADEKLQLQQQTNYTADVLQRRNRKRCNSDLNPASQLKKFRRGGGKDHVHDDTGSTKDSGSTTMSYESEALYVNTNNNNVEQSMITNNNCCWTAGNHNILNNCNNEYKSIENNVEYENNIEYEKILFETHGCSIYQFHRLQQIGNGSTETEF